jgi:hypothetical protein
MRREGKKRRGDGEIGRRGEILYMDRSVVDCKPQRGEIFVEK